MFNNVATQKTLVLKNINEEIMWHFAICEHNVSRHVYWCVASVIALTAFRWHPACLNDCQYSYKTCLAQKSEEENETALYHG